MEIAVLEKRIQNADVPVIAELGTSEISIQEFLMLDVGDVIELNQAIDQPLLIKIGEIPKFLGQPGKVNKKLAVQVLDTLKGKTMIMSDHMLSQDEIDALLRGTDSDDTEYPAAPHLHAEDYLSLMEKDALGKLEIFRLEAPLLLYLLC